MIRALRTHTADILGLMILAAPIAFFLFTTCGN